MPDYKSVWALDIKVIYLRDNILNGINEITVKVNNNMRIYLRLSRNQKVIPFTYQELLVGVIHKWIGSDNVIHGKSGQYSFSWIQNTSATKEGINLGDIAGGFFQGNILCSPDASAGTLIASIGYMILGIPGGILAAFFVFMGNRLCADPGYAGTTGSLTITVILFVCSFVGLTPEMFIAGICIAILTIQGIDQVRASIILGKIAKKFNRHAKE